MKLYLFTERDVRKALTHLRTLMDHPESDKWTEEIRVLASAIEAYENIHWPISHHMPEWRYYVFNPNSGAFVAGPFACKTVALMACHENTPQAGVPENEPYVVVDLLKEDILLHKVDYRKKSNE